MRSAATLHQFPCRLIAVAGGDPAIAELWDLDVRAITTTQHQTGCSVELPELFDDLQRTWGRH